MELVNVDGSSPTTFNRAGHNVTPDSSKSNYLHRSTTIICLSIFIVIIFSFYYVFLWPAPFSFDDQHIVHNRVVRQLYVNKLNSSQSRGILISTDSSCDQRKHDLKFGTKCESSKLEECDYIKPVERPKVSTHITSVVTAKGGSRFKTETFVSTTVNCGNMCQFKTRLTVLPEKKKQEIIGWGGALTDSSLFNIRGLSKNGSQRLIDDYFSKTDGLAFNMIRVTIGGSDFSLRFYTNDDSDGDDLKLEKFSLVEEDTEYKIPMLKYIKDRYKDTDIKVFASMWSPPVWMKTNGHYNQGQMKGKMHPELAELHPDEVYFAALAGLKKKFLLAYLDNSIDFWGLTVMNEPIFAIQPFLNFNTMIFPMQDYGSYVVKYLGPEIRSDPRLRHIKLMIHDDNRKYLLSHTYPILRQVKGLLNYTDGISVHGYADERYDLMGLVDQFQKDNLFVLPTELCSGHLPFMEKALIGNWHRGVHYGLDIIRSLQNSAAGWVDWNMALDTTGGPGWLGGRLDSPIIVDKDGDSYYRGPMFYVLGHFSRYIPPGSRRIESKIEFSQHDYPLEEVSFLMPNGKDITTVILNNNPYNIEMLIKVGELNQIFKRVTIEADSITTLLYLQEQS